MTDLYTYQVINSSGGSGSGCKHTHAWRHHSHAHAASATQQQVAQEQTAAQAQPNEQQQQPSSGMGSGSKGPVAATEIPRAAAAVTTVVVSADGDEQVDASPTRLSGLRTSDNGDSWSLKHSAAAAAVALAAAGPAGTKSLDSDNGSSACFPAAGASADAGVLRSSEDDVAAGQTDGSPSSSLKVSST
jgi:hypothetical protein